MDAPAYWKLGWIQQGNGLYTIKYLVFWKNIFPDLFDHVVQMDLSKNAGRPAAEPGMEIFASYQPGEFTGDNPDRDFGLAFLGKETRDWERGIGWGSGK